MKRAQVLGCVQTGVVLVMVLLLCPDADARKRKEIELSSKHVRLGQFITEDGYDPNSWGIVFGGKRYWGFDSGMDLFSIEEGDSVTVGQIRMQGYYAPTFTHFDLGIGAGVGLSFSADGSESDCPEVQEDTQQCEIGSSMHWTPFLLLVAETKEWHRLKAGVELTRAVFFPEGYLLPKTRFCLFLGFRYGGNPELAD